MNIRHAALLVLVLVLLSGCDKASETDLPPEAEGRTVLTLGVLFAYNDTKRNVVSNCHQVTDAFNAAQDEVWIVVRPYMDVNQTTDVDTGQQRMYAKLAAGDRPDLYDMVSINAQALRDAGYLADWYPLMEADPGFRKEDYFTNIWELLETDGRLYQMAVNFKLHGMFVPATAYTGQDGWTLAEYTAYMDEHGFVPGRDFFLSTMLFYGCQFEFVDLERDSCHFEDPAFLELLAYLQSLPEGEGSGDFTTAQITDVSNHLYQYRQHGAYPRVVGLPTRSRSGPAVSIADSYGLSSDTEHPEACWAFVRWLLAEEQQLVPVGESSVLYAGVPMLRSAWETQLYQASLDGGHEDSLFYRYMYTKVVGGKEIITDHPAVPQEELDYLRSTVESASYVSLGYFDYEDITAIVEEEILVFLAGDRTAGECARIIQSRVSTFLAERS